MAIKRNITDVTALYRGDVSISKVYRGDVEIFSAGPLLFLDEYPGANRAYSIRKLSSSYTGPAIEVKRSSDNTTTDIGFSNNELDVAELGTFVGAGNGFITKWYDQTGNGNHAVEDGSEPRIVDSGSVEEVTGEASITKPALRFIGSSTNYLKTTQMDPAPSAGSIFIVAKVITKTGSIFEFSDSLGGAGSSHHPWSDNVFYENFASTVNVRRNSSATGDTSLSQFYYNVIGTSAGHDMRLNGSNIFSTATNTPAFTTTKNYLIGRNEIGASAHPFDGFLQELIFYPSDMTASVTDIETNQNDYFGILT